ncbi:DUF3500 domain-containing protein [Octadecabacter sp. CECT 8868]|uniref:DUF3500 domain-containing protein n=1 Tax=Octadecabacter algicola TaxID=2909342 RepID=UPI001F363E08|nr:DUF3500 domain-containing protein [Octadecabacter algicola]MCF2906309.1 DUF3500 domain-containing protein [Octadecabacter algicola]
MSLSVKPLASAIALCASVTTAISQPAGGPPGEGGPEADPRQGDTSTLMSTVQIPDVVAECDAVEDYARLLCLTDVLIASIDDEELLENLQYDYSVEEAQNWSNLPAGAFPDRPGVFLGEFSLEQRGIVKAIMMQATSGTDNEGFDEMVQTLNADDYIGTISTDYKAGYSSFNTKFAFLGTPAETGTWQLYYGGHHLAFTNTYTDGALAGATPSFRGVEPFPRFYMNGRENIPLMQEREAFAALLRSLDDDQKAAALLEGTYHDILAGPQTDDGILDVQEGLAVTELSSEQVALLLAAIETYVGDLNAVDAATFMEKYAAELDETVLGYSGTTEVNTTDDYVRIHGPSLWLEFSLQTIKSTGEVGDHPHSVWRDITSDYGGN